jgi:asparagine synthase (glutamine-hydrolysing)
MNATAASPGDPPATLRGWFDPSASAQDAPPVAPAEPRGAHSIARRGLLIQLDPRHASAFEDDSTVCVCVGEPRFADAEFARMAVAQTPAAACRALYRDHGAELAVGLRGAFAVVVVDAAKGAAVLTVDRFSVKTLCYSIDDGRLAFSDRADSVPPERAREIDPQALFDYLYFHVIPAPRTIFRGVERLRAGHALALAGGRADLVRHWHPSFEERLGRPFEVLKREFRSLLEAAVSREAAGHRVGCFLSGGTDSSTVAGMLGRVTGRPAATFSIGFDAQGYDEMGYARIAARHFGVEHHERYIAPEDLVAGIPRVATWYDQPFGNSSAVPALVCATLAREAGLDKLLAGDGGDELFGGNARYATQRLLEAYSCLPAAVRGGLIEPVLLGVRPLGRIPLARKAAGYVRQARLRMPERLNAYNLLLRLGTEEVLAPDFLRSIDQEEPERAQRAVWDEVGGVAFINRMLAYDWKYTLADNDLPKVCGTAALAGIQVGFPLLADELVDFSLRLEPELKLKRLTLRYFFKEALRGFLPDEVIGKKKHGFGLPFGVWLASHAGLRALVRAAFARLDGRGIVKPGFLESLLTERLPEHPAYYGEMAWVLLMLEQWLAARAPGFAVK